MSIQAIYKAASNTVGNLIGSIELIADQAINGGCSFVPAYAVSGYNGYNAADNFCQRIQIMADSAEDGGDPSEKPSASKSGNLLKDKINNLMSVADDEDDEDDEELLEELSKPKKKFLGLF